MASQYIPVALERLVLERARGQCEYCRLPEAFSFVSFEIEHISPRALGGATEAENLALACSGCNGFKGTKTHGFDSETAELVALFHPRQHVWSEHFVWSRNGLSLEGQTPAGRATIETLKLNRSGVINLRRLLILDDRHPPED